MGAIQDNMAKTSLVQHTQTRGDDVQRGQDIAQTQAQKEESRQADQVVLQSGQKDERGIRPDEEKEKDGRKKRDDEDGENGEDDSSENGKKDGQKEEATGPRAKMRKINIVI